MRCGSPERFVAAAIVRLAAPATDAEATSAEAGGLEFVPAVVDADSACSRVVASRTWLNRSAVSLFAVLADHARCLLDSVRRSLICLLFRTWILKSSIRLPDFNCATSQRGCLPRPAQVSDG